MRPSPSIELAMNTARRRLDRAELVAPAGNPQKLRVAIAFGADAVYLSARELSLRAQSENFSPDQLAEAIKYAHDRKTYVYLLFNVFPHNQHLSEMQELLDSVARFAPDAIVVSDIGAFELVREKAPRIPIHISTQANVTNWRTAQFWERLGASRIIVARELSLKEIAEISSHVNMELEMFVHGAMCMAYSGRCFMSKHFVGRDSNLGDCAQPCRWTYRIVEETRPGEIFEIEEGAGGTLIFSSRDLCMINHIPEAISSGVRGLKIEGRMKSAYYVGVATRTYRRALDSYYSSPADYKPYPAWLEELQKTSNRDFTTGFYLGEMQAGLTPAGGARRKGAYSFVGIVAEVEGNKAMVEVRGRIEKGDTLECVQPNGQDFRHRVESMFDDCAKPVEVAQPNSVVYLPDLNIEPFSLLRKLTP